MIERDTIFIDGKWVDSAGNGTLTVINPATEEPFPRGHTQTAAPINDLDIAAASLHSIAWEERIGETIVRRVPAGVARAITRGTLRFG